ncbi:MAG: efflux RND transporter periplasmic adaptor subunit [Bryobacteraceae bacterium]
MKITIRRRTLILIFLVLIVVVVGWGVSRRAAPPQIPFVKVTRDTLTSTLTTNGKVEPIEWASARAERQGVIRKVFVQRGQQVAAGAPIVSLDDSAAAAELATAEAQIAGARAQERPLQQGGSAAERTEIDNQLAKATLDLATAQRDLASSQRLFDKQAGAKFEVDTNKTRVAALEEAIRGLEKRRAALVEPSQKQSAQAKLEEAEASASLARHNLELSVIHAPIGGTIYQFDQRVGGFLNAGDVVASIGRLEQVRVTVYVDEPDLGRIGIGMPVAITWQAMPGRVWKGIVEKLPTQIVPLVTREVGEVSCVIENPDRDLLPGTNIDAEIQSRVVKDALIVPKEVLRRDSGQTGVYLLGAGNRIEWRTVQIGISSLTKVQITQGLRDNDAVALPTDKPIKAGSKVEPVYQ